MLQGVQQGPGWLYHRWRDEVCIWVWEALWCPECCRFVLMHLPGKITYREIDEMIATVDKNEDWKISYSEFRVRAVILFFTWANIKWKEHNITICTMAKNGAVILTAINPFLYIFPIKDSTSGHVGSNSFGSSWCHPWTEVKTENISLWASTMKAGNECVC